MLVISTYIETPSHITNHKKGVLFFMWPQEEQSNCCLQYKWTQNTHVLEMKIQINLHNLRQISKKIARQDALA